MEEQAPGHGPDRIRRSSLVAGLAALALALGTPTGVEAQQDADTAERPSAAADVQGREYRAVRPGDPLSLDDALELARLNNPDYRIQEREQRSADLQVRQAWGNLLPSADVSNSMNYQASGERRFGDIGLGTQPATLTSSYNLGFSLTLNGSSLLEPRAARARARAAEARVRGAAVGLEEEVTAAYLTALEADAELDRARTELERARSQVRQAEAQVEVGAATDLDIRRAEVQEGQAEVSVLQAENDVVTTRLALGRTLGVDLPPDVELTTDFARFEPDLDVDELVSLAMDRNPVLRASRAEENAADTQVDVARSQWLPSVSLSAGIRGFVTEARTIDPLVQQQLAQMGSSYEDCLYDNRIRELLGDAPRSCEQLNPERSEVVTGVRSRVRSQNSGFPFGYETQPWSMSLTVSLPLFTGFSRDVQRQEAQIARSNARERVRSEELRLRSEVESAVRSVETAHRVVEVQARVRETAADELELAQERFRLGLANSIEVVDAQANLSDAERQEIAALYDFHRAFVTLESLVGTSLR